MSYNNYKQVSSWGSSRGRGYNSRGTSFRGRGGGGDSSGSWGTTSPGSRGRGGYSSRGRFNWNKEHYGGGFESRSRYQGGNAVGDGERYSSRGRGDDSAYRRYSRPV
ncbi:unnamed protein product, partial [Timema podura]|nr:unnamed protein product [Timema podura]